MKKKLIISMICLYIIIAIVTIAGFNLYNHYSIKEQAFRESESLIKLEDIDYFKIKCFDDNKTISEVMHCSEEYVNMIYKYNITSDDVKLDYNDLVLRGGDCKDWSEFWLRLGVMYDYTVRKEVFAVNERVDHAMALITNSEGYCFAVLNHVDCYEYIKE